MNLNKIIRNSTYSVSKDLYSIAKVSKRNETDNYFFISVDEIEITVIYNQRNKIKNILDEKNNYKLIGINVAIPFYSPGFIAKITKNLAKHSISVLVVSTFSRDYFIVHKSDLKQAIKVLNKLGIKQT